MSENFIEYSVIQGLKHVRYDYEDSKIFLDRVMPSIVEFRMSLKTDIYKWQEIDPKVLIHVYGD